MLGRNEVVDVRDADLRWVARIDGATARTRAIKFGRGVVGVDDIFRLESEAGEIRVEQRRVGIGIEKARDADALILALLHCRRAFFHRL